MNPARYAGWLLSAFFLAVADGAAAKMSDGWVLESAHILPRGVWNLKTNIDIGKGADPVKVPAAYTGTGSDKTLEVGGIRLPIEIRYGLTEAWEIGGELGIESDKGGIEIGSKSLFNGSGIQRIRLMGKWNFMESLAGMADLSLLGDNELYYSLDSFDFGLKFIYGPKLGPGHLNVNLGFLFKGGDVGINPTLPIDYDHVIGFGFGYVFPVGDRFSGSAEFSFATSPYEGSSGVSTEGMMGLNLGARYLLVEALALDGGLGFGFDKGSPALEVKIGIDWMLGGDYNEKFAAKPAISGTTQAKTPTKAPEAPAAAQPQKAAVEQAKPAEPPLVSTEIDFQKRVAEASAAFERGDYVSATANYERAAKLKADDPIVHYNLATAYFQMKRYADAKVYYRNAVTLNPRDPDSHFYLGYAYYYLGDKTSAAKEWRNALELDPTYMHAQEALKSIGAGSVK